MVGFVITGHGQFAPGIESALMMVAGVCDNVQVVPFDEAAAATYSEELTSAIGAMASSCDGVVVFADLIGGTPFNVSMLCAAETPGVEVVGGVNLPMAIETLFMRNADESLSAADLAEIAVSAGVSGISHRVLEVVEDVEEDSEEGI